MFTLAIRAGKVGQRPYIPTLHENNVRTGFFEEPESRALHTNLPDYLKPVIEFASLTGWRVRSEILLLTWPQVDFQGGIVRLEPGTTKNDDGRVFPFSVLPPLEALLRRQRECTLEIQRAMGRIVPWVFHRNGARIRDFRSVWQTACRRAGLDGRVPHDFRRTAVRNLERSGVPRSVAMKLVGHRTESIYRRYAIVSEADLTEGVKKLAVRYESEASTPRTVLPLREASGREVAKF